MKRKINIIQLLAIALLATSITLFDFQNPSWDGNEKNYIGLSLGIALLMWNKLKK
ncbi:hypothetical protein SAMN05421640_2548 [Ekhidna lutea]|uniref:Uncharacterized protein n=1 Tax=Ekhidna lutea TaxID=447679 RepID=A0A239KCL7_EKHLU|nr:hypothetical protein [Ekhidna lutea]SNT15452.1 hypothetical protein SAMN05421640_2548 [Ekhidna lutea]